MKCLLGLTGFGFSGKDTFADILVDKYGFKKYVMSDILKEEAKKRGLPQTKETFVYLGDLLRKESGRREIIAELLWKKIKKEKPKYAVISGLRSLEENIFFSLKSKKYHLIYIYSPIEKRIERAKMLGFEKKFVIERDKKDINSKGLLGVILNAEYIIINDSSKEELSKKAKNLLYHLGVIK